MIIDSHMHANSLIGSSQNVIDNVLNCEYIHNAINVGLNIDTSKESIRIAKKYDKFYSAVGIHPLYINFQDCSELYKMARSEKVVAIGEIGLDSTMKNFDVQKFYLIRQIAIANELQLPVIIHSNNMNKEVIDIFEKYIKPEYGCVFHCFQPDFDTLDYLIKNGFYISFAGKVTYKNAKKSIEIAKMVPDNLYLVETDSPYISPEPYRNDLNFPSNIKYIVERLAGVKCVESMKIEHQTIENTKRLFKKMQ